MQTLSATRLSQPIPDTPCNAAESRIKTYGELGHSEVIECYTEARVRGKHSGPARFFVCGKRIQGCYVRLDLHPAHLKTWRMASVIQATFRADVPVEVLGRHLPVKSEEALKQAVLEAMQPGQEPLSPYEVELAIRSAGCTYHCFSRIRSTCVSLAKEGALVQRKRGSQNIYRRPLPREEGLPVVDMLGFPSERIGWIKEWKTNKQSGKTHPIVQYIDGTWAFSTEERLDPVAGGYRLTWIEQIRSGNIPELPSTAWVPSELIRECRQRSAHDTVPGAVMQAIATHLGICDGREGYGRQARVATVEHLDHFYPGWRYGFNVHDQRQERGNVA